MSLITVLAPIFWPMDGKCYRYYGGVEPLIEGLMSEWTKMGYDVQCICAHESKSWDGVSIYNAPQALPPNSNTIAYERELFQRYEKEILKSDIIFDNTHFMPSFIEKHLKKWNVPIWATWHHSPNNLQSMPPVDSDHFIAISKWQQKALEEKFGIPLHQVYNPIRQDIYADLKDRDSNNDYWLFLGRLSTVKGVHFIPQLAYDFPDEQFVITGDAVFTGEAGLAHWLLRKADELPNLKLHFNCNFEEKCDYLQNSKGLLHTAIWPEPFGLILLESFQFGKPALAFNRGASAEIIKHKKNGYLIDEHGRNAEEDYHLYKKGFIKFREQKWNSKSIRHIEKRFTNEFAAKEYLKIFGI